MHLLQVIFLAVVQAATEFLPISSSGHLLFFKGLWGLEDLPVIFDITVHLGSLAAILIFYRQRIVQTLTGGLRELKDQHGDKSNLKFIMMIALTTGITLLFFMLFQEGIESRYQSPTILPITFLLTTIILLLPRFFRRSEDKTVTQRGWLLPIVVGLLQGLAILPGVSRSGSTISPMLMMGVRKEEAAYFSFFLAIPAILGAMVFEVVKLENLSFISEHGWVMALTLLVSAGCSYLFLRLLTLLIRKGRFWLFSFYTMAMAVVSFFIFA